MSKHKLTRISLKIAKVIGWSLLGIILLLIGLILSLRIPSVQQYITSEAVKFFKNKVDTEATIGRLYVDFPKKIVVEDIYVEDLQGDTLVYSQYIAVDTDLWGLLNNRFEINDLEVRRLVANIYNTPDDSTFNYQFIIDGFTASSPSPGEDTTASDPFTFAIYEADIQNSRVSYKDFSGGMKFLADIGSFHTSLSEFNLEELIIGIDEVTLKDSRGEFIIHKQTASDTTSSEMIDISGKSLLIDNVKFTFEDKHGGLKLFTDIGRVEVDIDEIDIAKQVYQADKISILNSFVSIDQYSNMDTVKAEADTDTVATGAIEMLASSTKVMIKNTSFRYYDHNYPTVKGFDPSHLWVQQLNAELESIQFKNGYAEGEVNELSVREKGGMFLEQLKTTFKYGESESYARNLELRTKHTNVSGDLQVSYPSIEALQRNPERVTVDAGFSRSRFDLEDLFYFQPSLEAEMADLASAAHQVIFEGSVEGQLANLTVRQFEVEALRSTRVEVSGNLKGLPDMNTLSWNVELRELITTRKDIVSAVPDTLLPQDMTLPAEITITGTSEGSMKDFKSKVNIKTSYGQATADVRLTQKTAELYGYNGRLEIDEFNVGALLNQEEQMGAVTLNASVDGEGFSLENINTLIEGEVSSFIYNQHNYEDLNIKGNVRSMEFQGKVSMDDSNLDFDFEGLVNLNDSIPQYNFILDLQTIDLQALNFSEEELKIRAKVTSDIRTSAVENINGTLEIEDLMITRAETAYRMDTFLLQATTDKDITDITIFSNVIDAQFKGNFDIVKLPEVLQRHVNRYYSLAGVPDVDELEPQQFDFNVNVKRPRFFSEILVPGLAELEPGPINGSYNSDQWALDINIEVPKIVYSGTIIDSLRIHLYSNEEHFGYETEVAEVTVGDTRVENVHLTGIVEAGHIASDLMIKDENGENKYLIGGIFISGEEYSRFQFTPGKFMLNYESWSVKPSNSIDFYPSGMWVQNMTISNGDQQIAVESTINQENDSILTTEIDDFDLGFVGKVKESEQYIIAGILNGEIDINMEAATFAFTSDLDIADFSFKGDTLGNVMLQAYNEGGGKYNLDLKLQSKANDLKIQGYYVADSVPDMNLNVRLVKFDLSTAESFTMGQMKDISGFLTGDMKVTGSLNKPDIVGGITFNSVSFRTTLLGANMSINNETIKFNSSGILFDDFIIKDKNDHTARVQGQVLTEDYTTFDLKLDVTTREFLLVNTTKEDNDLFYGKLEVNSTAKIRGTSLKPDIELNVNLENDSHLTYIIPEEEIQLQEREGVVEFFDKDMEEDPFLKDEQKSAATDSIKSTLKGITLTAKIDVNRNNKFSVVIDPVTGDQLTVQGDANLTFGIKPSGDMTMTGRYEVYEGHYNLNFYGMVKRQFAIAQGSYLVWSGDPLNARMDITAKYTVSAVYETPGQAEASSQKVPFIVYLDLKNELLDPEISFRLGLEEGVSAAGAQSFVSNVNKDENELNTQVFYLLLFKSTKSLGSYSTTGGGGNIAESTARSSASRLLSNQLNRLAGRIEGVELSLDLESYGTADDATTQLELGLSKELFDSRVIVKVAGNFGLEGQEAEQQQNFSDFAGDIRVEYKITKDGRFRLVGFRENEYDNLLQGAIIKTGAGIIFVKDYDTLKELFTGKENKEKNK